MTLAQVLRIVVRYGNLILSVLSHQRLQRQINREARSGHHQRRSTFRAAKDEDLRRRHLQPNFLSLAAVIDQGKHLKTFFRKSSLQTLHRFIDRKTTGDLDESICQQIHLPKELRVGRMSETRFRLQENSPRSRALGTAPQEPP